MSCPYRCSASKMVVDRRRGTLTPCPHCFQESLVTVMEDKDFYQTLGFPYDPGLTPELDPESLILQSELNYINPETLTSLTEKVKEVNVSLSRGVLPKRSLLFGLGIRGRLIQLQYPMLANAYLGGLSFHPLVSAHDLEIWKLREDIDKLEELYSKKFVVVTIEEGTSRAGLQVCKGVMQVRAARGFPTVFVTTWSTSSVITLVDSDPDGGLFLAEPHMVEYTSQDSTKYSKYVLGVLGLDNMIGDSNGN